jgi:hypothetical protein
VRVVLPVKAARFPLFHERTGVALNPLARLECPGDWLPRGHSVARGSFNNSENPQTFMSRCCKVLVCLTVFSFWLQSALAVPTYDKVVVVIEENHSFQQILGSANAPFINQLANEGVSFTNFYAITHPSQPNYLQMYSGSNQGVLDDDLPPTYPTPFTTPNLGAELRAAGRTFGGYSQGLPSVGYNGFESGDYVRRHNPWTNWQNNAANAGPNALPSSVNMPFTSFPTTPAGYANLPTVSFVVPDLQHDMHEGTVQAADTWLQTNLNGYYQWAKNNNSLLVVTWDEDNFNSANGNRIPTIFAGAGLRIGQNNTTFTHHNLLHTIEDMYGLGHAGGSADVGPIFNVFAGEPLISTATRTFRDGASGYQGTQDTFISGNAPGTVNGAAALITVDGDLSAGQPAQGLIRFDNIIGNGPGQVPPGSHIVSATLRVNNDARSDNIMRLHPMLAAWDESSTWNSLAGGISPNGIEASADAEFAIEPGSSQTSVVFVVSESLQRWVNGEANFGWALLPTGTDGWAFNSAEAPTLTDRPILEVVYALPVPEPGSGTLLLMGAAVVGCTLRRWRLMQR